MIDSRNDATSASRQRPPPLHAESGYKPESSQARPFAFRVEAEPVRAVVREALEPNVSGARRLGWAGARLAFYAYIGFSMVTLVGGFLTAPLMTHLFYNDWRFWRHWRRAWRLFPHSWNIAWLMLRREGEFMLSVPLTSAPRSKPDQGLVELAPGWAHGAGCGDCQRCCHILWLRCPVLDTASGFCSGYNSFYWRYFNCGRYPSRAVEIEYYGCDKWRMKVVPINKASRR